MNNTKTEDTIRPAVPRKHPATLAVVLALATAVAGLVLAIGGPAGASTLNGVATIASPGTTTPLTSGGSATQFTVSLPARAACDGDTASDGYHVYSYLVEKGTTLSSVTFLSHPSEGYGLFESNGEYYGPVNTAVTTGAVPNPLPNDFEWSQLVSHGVTLAQLLYTGSGSTASGIWEGGIACANSSGDLADNWNTEVTFHASSTDTDGFTWTAVPGPSGSAPAAFTSLSAFTFVKGDASTFTVTASGSPKPTLSETGKLPAGVTFKASTGVLSGTPTTLGSSTVTFSASNGIESPATQTFKLTIGEIAITSTTLSTATRGKAFSLQLVEKGGKSPFTWTNTTPKLPTGLKLSTAGKITGTIPTSFKAGSYKVGFSLKDSTKPTALTTTATLPLTVK